jgi:hypothetical protein
MQDPSCNSIVIVNFVRLHFLARASCSSKARCLPWQLQVRYAKLYHFYDHSFTDRKEAYPISKERRIQCLDWLQTENLVK